MVAPTLLRPIDVPPAQTDSQFGTLYAQRTNRAANPAGNLSYAQPLFEKSWNISEGCQRNFSAHLYSQPTNFPMPLVSHNRTALFVPVGATQGLFQFGRAVLRGWFGAPKKLVQQNAIDLLETELIFGACPPERLGRDIGRAALNWRPPEGLVPIPNPHCLQLHSGDRDQSSRPSPPPNWPASHHANRAEEGPLHGDKM